MSLQDFNLLKAAFNKQYHPDKTLLIGNEGLPWKEFLALSPNDL